MTPSLSYVDIIPEYPHPGDVKNLSELTYEETEKDIRAYLHSLSCAPEKANILNILMQYGVFPDGLLLTNLVAFEFPLDMIRQVNDERLMSHGYDYGNNIIADYMFFAAFHKDPKVLDFFVASHKTDEVNIVLKSLSKLKDWNIKGLQLTVENKTKIFSHEACQEAAYKLLKSAKHLPLNKKVILDYLLHCILDAKTPEAWQKIYRDHIDEPYLHNKYYFSIFRKPYSKIKKIFIENIQRNIVEYFMDHEVVTTFLKEKNIRVYHAMCRDMLQSDIFSPVHEKYGVNAIFRRNLKHRVEDIEHGYHCHSRTRENG